MHSRQLCHWVGGVVHTKQCECDHKWETTWGNPNSVNRCKYKFYYTSCPTQ